MKTLLRASLAALIFGAVAGCAAPRGSLASAISADKARDVAIGRSTKSDVIAALGQTAVVRFDSGYEVWVYRIGGGLSVARNEFVVLFSPSGVVAKTRIRLAPAHGNAARE